MSVQIAEREREPVAGADWTALTPEEYAAEARSYFAYAGRFSVDEAAGTVTHHVELSLFPGWAGLSMPRAVELDGDRLVLSSASPVESGGRQVIVRISWARAWQLPARPLAYCPPIDWSPARAAFAYRFTPALAAAGDIPERTNGE